MATKRDATLEKQVVELEKYNYIVIPPNRCSCIYHKDSAKNLAISNFYDTSDSSIFKHAPNGKIPICKACIRDIYSNYFNLSQNVQWALYKTCEKLDIPFLLSVYEGALKESKEEWQRVWGFYIKTYNSLKSINGWKYNFDNSDNVELEFSKDGIIKIENRDVKLKNEDKKTKKNVIDLIGYEPYEDYGIEDQKFLYNNIVNYLDEETLQDQYKVSAIIEIVDNSNQIRKHQLVKNKYMTDKNMILDNVDKLRSLEEIIKRLVENNDKLAKENGISAKNRVDKSMNKSTLTGKMKYLSELNFDQIEIDYYDQMVCFGMQRAASISMKAIKEQLNWDEDTSNEVIITQRGLIEKLQNDVLKLEEKERKLNLEIDGDNSIKSEDDVYG